jgi:hypothetical protein
VLYFLNCHDSDYAYRLRNLTTYPVAYIGGPVYFYGIIVHDTVSPSLGFKYKTIKHLTFKDRVFYNKDHWEPT